MEDAHRECMLIPGPHKLKAFCTDPTKGIDAKRVFSSDSGVFKFPLRSVAPVVKTAKIEQFFSNLDSNFRHSQNPQTVDNNRFERDAVNAPGFSASSLAAPLKRSVLAHRSPQRGHFCFICESSEG